MDNIGMLIGVIGLGAGAYFFMQNQKTKKQTEATSKILVSLSRQGLDFGKYGLSEEELGAIREMVQSSSSKVIPTATLSVPLTQE